MTSKLLVVEVVRFVATEQCITNPSHFRAIRDFVAHDRKDKGLTAQYWGASVERPNEFFWILLWQSRAHAAAFEEDPSYMAFTQQRQALAKAPVLAMFIRMSGNPLHSLEAPVTEVDMYQVRAEDTEGAQDLIRSITYRVESMLVRGFVALSWGIALEDGRRGTYFAGWRSVEDHMNLGTIEEHKVFVQESEQIFESFTELYISHVPFKLHETK